MHDHDEKRFTVRIDDPKLYDQLSSVTRLTGRTTNAVVIMALRSYLPGAVRAGMSGYEAVVEHARESLGEGE